MKLKHLLVDYTNHRGERAIRQIMPIRLYFGSTQWHPQEQWMLEVYDHDKDAVRDYAIAGVHQWGMPGELVSAIDATIAKQLQRSMERNARMSNRLKKLQSSFRDTETTLGLGAYAERAIESILKDEEPTWGD